MNITNDFTNEYNGCNLCKMKLFKTRNGHLNSIKHMYNLKRYKKEHNLLPHDERNPCLADLLQTVYVIDKLNNR